MSYGFVTLVSDFGCRDESLGVVTSVIANLAPNARVIDLTHGLDAHDVRAAALTLVRSANHMAAGVVMVCVDNAEPANRYLAVEVGGGESVLLAPDNGVLAPVVAMVGGPSTVVEISPEPPVRWRYAARDVLAPAAALLCNGADLAELGQHLDVSQLTPMMLPFSTFEDGKLVGEVLHLDRYGWTHVNITDDQLAMLQASSVRIEGAGGSTRIDLEQLGTEDGGLVFPPLLGVVLKEGDSVTIAPA